MYKLSMPEQPEKADIPMLEMLSGITMVLPMPVCPQKHYAGMELTESPNTSVVKLGLLVL